MSSTTFTATTIDGVRIVPAARSCGAWITGVDIRAMDDATLALVQGAVTEHLVVCMRDQGAATPDDQVAFAKRWGTIEPHPYVRPIDGHPEVMEIYDPNALTQTWHSDFTYAAHPPSYAFLLARILPTTGGDTMFSNTYLAYEGLSEGLKRTLSGLRAVHHATELALRSGFTKEETTRPHPVVRTHPLTGRSALFVNADYVDNFEGWTIEESQPLLRYLFAQCTRMELTYRHRWLSGDLLIWDNRCTQHAVIGDTGGEKRSLHRVTIEGEVPIPA